MKKIFNTYIVPCIAELIGTMLIVFMGCAELTNQTGSGSLATAFSFALTMMLVTLLFTPISGAHFNPVVSMVELINKKLCYVMIVPYIACQVLGAVVGAGLLYYIVDNRPIGPMWNQVNNGYDSMSPEGYSYEACSLVEILTTAVFILVVQVVTKSKMSMQWFIIGMAYGAVHLVSLHITRTSINPARSTGTAVWGSTDNVEQLWVFWTMPVVGGLLGVALHKLYERLITASEDGNVDDISTTRRGPNVRV